MTIIHVQILECDRCKARMNREDYMKGNSWAQTDVAWAGDRGGRSWQGDAGGTNHKGKAWLCEQCTDAFLKFMEPITKDQA